MGELSVLAASSMYMRTGGVHFTTVDSSHE